MSARLTAILVLATLVLVLGALSLVSREVLTPVRPSGDEETDVTRDAAPSQAASIGPQAAAPGTPAPVPTPPLVIHGRPRDASGDVLSASAVLAGATSTGSGAVVLGGTTGSPIAGRQGAGAISSATAEALQTAAIAGADGRTPGPNETLPAGSKTPGADNGSIAGRVVGQLTAQGMPDISVACRRQSGGKNPAEGTTDAEGWFVFTQLAPGDYYVSVAREKASAMVAVQSGEVSQVLLEIKDTTEIAGHVLDSDKAPVAGATVRLYRRSDRKQVLDQTTSDAAGGYALLNVPILTPLEVLAQLPGYANGLRNVRLKRLEPEYDLDVVLVPQGEVYGNVTNTDGDPLVGVTIRLRPTKPDMEAKAKGGQTGEAGHYRIRGLASGTWRISAALEGYVTVERSISIAHPKTSVKQDFRLQAAGFVEGRVVDAETDAPIENATIRAKPGKDLTTRSGADGAFRLEDLKSEVTYTLTATHKQYGTEEIPNVQPGRTDLVFRLKKTAYLELRVYGATGGLVPSYRIAFEPVGHGVPMLPGYLYTGLPVYPDGAETWSITPADYDITVTAEGLRQETFPVRGLVAGETLPLEVTLQYGEQLIGETRDAESGGPVAGARVEAFRGALGLPASMQVRTVGGPAATALSNGAGLFVLEGLPEGPVTLVAAAPGYFPAGRNDVFIPYGGGPVVLQLRR